MKTLLIDTSDNKKVAVGLRIGAQEYISESELGIHTSQVVLPMIEKLFSKHKLTLHDLTEVEVCAGPGSFTGLRVGCSIANALSYSLGISVNGKQIGQIVEPIYEWYTKK